MFKILAYLIAILNLYRRQIFSILFILLAIAIFFRITQREKNLLPNNFFSPSNQVTMGLAKVVVGERFTSLAELTLAEKRSGYEKIGQFGHDWPATVTEIATSSDRISFARQNGTRHTYKGFGGYRLKLVRLEGESGEEVILIFRSES